MPAYMGATSVCAHGGKSRGEKGIPLPTAGPEALALSAEPASPSLGSCGTEPRPGEGKPAREKQPGGDEQREHEELRHNGQLVEE